MEHALLTEKLLCTASNTAFILDGDGPVKKKILVNSFTMFLNTMPINNEEPCLFIFSNIVPNTVLLLNRTVVSIP
jgi:hypothetical protein